MLAVTAASFDPELRATLAQLQASSAFQAQLTVFLAHKGSVPPSVDAFARICIEVHILLLLVMKSAVYGQEGGSARWKHRSRGQATKQAESSHVGGRYASSRQGISEQRTSGARQRRENGRPQRRSAWQRRSARPGAPAPVLVPCACCVTGSRASHDSIIAMQACNRGCAPSVRSKNKVSTLQCAARRITMLATALASFDPQLLPRPHQLLASQTFQHQLKTFLASEGDPSALPGPGAFTMICKEVQKPSLAVTPAVCICLPHI